MHFFDAAMLGQPLLWQHLFWIFGHPWVYIIVLPAMSMASDMIPTFSRRPLVAYPYVAFATVAVGIIGFGVWAHHMFATGLPTVSLSFFSGASLIIAIPSAVSVFAWLATIWQGRPVFNTAFLFLVGFILTFVIGGVSGVMTGSVPFDWQLTDTYFVVGHLHYVLIGINLFPVIAGTYYWFPKMTGRLMNERLGRWNFWLMFIGFNVGFFPMHIAGFLGMPRRIYTYQAGMGWDAVNMVITVGAFLFALGFLLMLVNVAWSLRRGEGAPSNPWNAGTLEWAVSSPPPPYNFAAIPRIRSRHPLWEGDRPTEKASVLDQGPPLDEGHQAVSTSPQDAVPRAILEMPGDTLWPFFLSAAVLLLFYALLWDLWVVAGIAAVGTAISIVGWLWPGEAT
jgi:heme/copper-type cytochrome/quinol oxidase subunit 1